MYLTYKSINIHRIRCFHFHEDFTFSVQSEKQGWNSSVMVNRETDASRAQRPQDSHTEDSEDSSVPPPVFGFCSVFVKRHRRDWNLVPQWPQFPQ